LEESLTMTINNANWMNTTKHKTIEHDNGNWNVDGCDNWNQNIDSGASFGSQVPNTTMQWKPKHIRPCFIISWTWIVNYHKLNRYYHIQLQVVLNSKNWLCKLALERGIKEHQAWNPPILPKFSIFLRSFAMMRS
jgi:hypothetical protein